MKFGHGLSVVLIALLTLPGSMATRADEGQVINLARADRDQPGDNSFVLTGPQYTFNALREVLSTNLDSIFSSMHPSTDDPTIRDVSIQVNGNNIQFNFEKWATFFWDPIHISGTTSLQSASCPENVPQGLQINLVTTGQTSQEASGYVDGGRILICTAQSETAFSVEMERDLYAGPLYQDWIGQLMGDFLRPFGPTLELSLQGNPSPPLVFPWF